MPHSTGGGKATPLVAGGGHAAGGRGKTRHNRKRGRR